MWKSQQNQAELIFTAGPGADVTADPARPELKNTLRGEGMVWEPWDELVTFSWSSSASSQPGGYHQHSRFFKTTFNFNIFTCWVILSYSDV